MCAGTFVLLTALGGCSAVRLAYGQAPSLAYWWIDDFVDLTDGQSTVLRQDIDAFFAWHRAQELPLYAERLTQWQSMATQDTTADKSCQQFEVLRAAYQRSIERAIDPLARLAVNLKPDQLQHLARHHVKSNKKFASEWLDDGVQARKERLYGKALDRYETLYGDLSQAQRTLLKVRTDASGFDPQRVQTERKRRQADLLATLKQAQAQPAEAAGLLRQWHTRVLSSPDASYAAYSKALIRQGCDQYAALHNTTSPEQRAHAVGVLKGYETDLLALTRPD
ncbi:hypothetical protein LPB072_19685 [Hydrogenophaga crassostreae]|uniref:Lipoprotein n=1 Tax=Hydrogenophaga crassostreae TaxID=1763535 RepID=A0A1D8P3A5_9BURK|nr:hypothetical protein LPB072_19685 [Hydrogenophaga crassostreae]